MDRGTMTPETITILKGMHGPWLNAEERSQNGLVVTDTWEKK